MWFSCAYRYLGLEGACGALCAGTDWRQRLRTDTHANGMGPRVQCYVVGLVDPLFFLVNATGSR